MIDQTELAELKAEIRHLRQMVVDLTQRAKRAEALAERDVLTPVLNRRGFVTHVNRIMDYCRRHSVQAVLVYLDMDDFKQINDEMGHASGDAALIQVAEILLSNVRGSDVVGRLGGDEFALVLLNADLEQGVTKGDQIQSLMVDQGFSFAGETVPLKGSFGVQAYEGQADAEAWLAQADAAMLEAKRSR